ncbi:CYFA0S03e00474g1_1 [Cyberlindnera fabianii]|uniref:CYFA0S03e00474g1_1 n=1 Tax=Cyberlindnera fabianii TaxID=36022 RepID=A0A061AWT2_CYBFA|nr:KNR4/SMI1 [Cyberlindnera fabianii]CDR39174.1 CYFA0S03e00474g1_1 [Cyberlindnera fabianii]
MGFKDKINQILYAFSTEDRYAEYDTHNHHIRTAAQAASQGRADGIQLHDAAGFTDDETSTPGAVNSTEGVSETILAWRHIETWTSENHPDLNATLSDPCTRADIANAERDLGVEFPAPLRASFRIHDGQEDLESLTGSGGLVFGLPLMSLAEVVEMTKTWRVVTEKMNIDKQIKDNEAARQKLISPVGSSAEVNQSTASLVETKPGFNKVASNDSTVDPDLERKISTSHSKKFKSHIPKQQSFPPGYIQPVYANDSWIPLLTDYAGNHIGVDLAPGPKGKYGQVIIFGREFDTKFLLASSWGDFLLSFVKDLEEGNYILDDGGREEDMFAGEGELLFYDKKSQRELPYLRVLTQRVFEKYKEYLPKRPQPQHKPSTTASSATVVPSTTTDNKQTETKKADRVISQDITATKDNKENEPAKAEVSLIDDTDDTTAADKSQDITDKVASDFKDVTI